MENRSFELSRQRRRRLLRTARKCRDADQRVRYMVIVHSAEGKRVKEIAAALGCCERTVKRARSRWRDAGEAGLIDRREDNSRSAKADEHYLRTLWWVLQFTPPEHGHRRSTWTLRLLSETLADYTGVRLSTSRLSRLLRSMGVRRGRPKPTVGCPWSRRARNRRLRMLRELIEHLPPDEAAVWEDEVDLDLNPRIGPDWMLPGQQREVPTPGQNRKRYLAGAMDARTDRVLWVQSDRKNSDLFIAMLRKLLRVYPEKRRIHVILDNYKIHSSRQTRAWLAAHGERIRPHFLPPYCPDDNRIERCVWRELHQNVTYNHTCPDLDELMDEVIAWLRRRNRRCRKAA